MLRDRYELLRPQIVERWMIELMKRARKRTRRNTITETDTDHNLRCNYKNTVIHRWVEYGPPLPKMSYMNSAIYNIAHPHHQPTPTGDSPRDSLSEASLPLGLFLVVQASP